MTKRKRKDHLHFNMKSNQNDKRIRNTCILIAYNSLSVLIEIIFLMIIITEWMHIFLKNSKSWESWKIENDFPSKSHIGRRVIDWQPAETENLLKAISMVALPEHLSASYLFVKKASMFARGRTVH